MLRIKLIIERHVAFSMVHVQKLRIHAGSRKLLNVFFPFSLKSNASMARLALDETFELEMRTNALKIALR